MLDLDDVGAPVTDRRGGRGNESPVGHLDETDARENLRHDGTSAWKAHQLSAAGPKEKWRGPNVGLPKDNPLAVSREGASFRREARSLSTTHPVPSKEKPHGPSELPGCGFSGCGIQPRALWMIRNVS
jgi:hypothetical protein